MTDQNKPAEEVPTGCLACNREPVVAFLAAHGIDMTRLVEVPPPRHAWSDVTEKCEECGACFLIKPRTN